MRFIKGPFIKRPCINVLMVCSCASRKAPLCNWFDVSLRDIEPIPLKKPGLVSQQACTTRKPFNMGMRILEKGGFFVFHSMIRLAEQRRRDQKSCICDERRVCYGYEQRRASNETIFSLALKSVEGSSRLRCVCSGNNQIDWLLKDDSSLN